MEDLLDPPEWTEADFASAIKARVRRRIMGGVVEPGDVEALQRFVCLTEGQFANALGLPEETLRAWNRTGVSDGPGRALLMIAARHPRAIRDNLLPPAADPRKTTLTVGRHRVVCEYQPVELPDGSLGISGDELGRIELCAAITVLSEATAFVASAEMRCARKMLGLRAPELAHVLGVTEADVLDWEANPDAISPERRQALLQLLERARPARTGPRDVRIMSEAEVHAARESTP